MTDKSQRNNAKSKYGLEHYVYMEWLFPIRDYYSSIRKNEVVFEIVIPFAISLFCTHVCFMKGQLLVALDKLSELLPTVISILIGFTIMLITLLLTGNGSNIRRLRETIDESKMLHKKPLTLYQKLHIQFSHSLFSEISLLLFIFFYLFLKGVSLSPPVGFVLLLTEVYLTLNILLSILRGTVNLYLSFYNLHKEE